MKGTGVQGWLKEGCEHNKGSVPTIRVRSSAFKCGFGLTVVRVGHVFDVTWLSALLRLEPPT